MTEKNFETIAHDFYCTNKKLPTTYDLVDLTGEDLNTIKKECQFVPTAISDIQTALVKFLGSKYKAFFNIVPADLPDTYPMYKAIELHLIGLDDGDIMNVKISPHPYNLSIEMEATNLPKLSKLLKKVYKQYGKHNCSAKENSTAEVQTDFYTTVESKEAEEICPYHKMKLYFKEFTGNEVMEEVVDFVLKNRMLFSYIQLLNGDTISNAATIKTVLDEVGIDILQEDTRIVAIAQTILEVPGKERMRLTFGDPIHIELIDSSLEIFIDKKCCHISSDLGSINHELEDEIKEELLSGELQPWFGDLDTGTNGYLYIDAKNHLRYNILFNHPKKSVSKLSKLIKKRLRFALKMKSDYKNYISTVFGLEE